MTQERGPNMGEMDLQVPERQHLQPGQVVSGTVVHISESHVFLDLGGKAEASLDVREVVDDKGEVSLQPGDTLEAYVVAVEPEVVLSHGMARSQLNLGALENAQEAGLPVEGKITAMNKGGLEVDLGGARGFCPLSQIELGFCEDPGRYVEQTLKFKVIEIRQEGRNIVVSRRALLEEERQESARAIQDQLQEGAEFEGEVVTLQPYGAFVDIGGIQGLVHISEITHGHLSHPQEALAVGQRVRVKVLKIQADPKNPDRQRVGLSIRALMQNPWDQVTSELTEGGTTSGKVVRLQPFGAFVELAPGVDGLIHISEMADRRIQHPSDVVSVGESVEVTVLKVDHGSRRISLSLRGGQSSGGGGGDLSVGSVVDVVVDRIKPFGLLVSLKGFSRNTRGLVPVEETGAGRNANLRRSYPEGTELRAMVIQHDPGSGKIKLSLKAVGKADEQREYQKFMGDRPRGGGANRGGDGERSLGTLGDLFQNALKKK